MPPIPSIPGTRPGGAVWIPQGNRELLEILERLEKLEGLIAQGPTITPTELNTEREIEEHFTVSATQSALVVIQFVLQISPAKLFARVTATLNGANAGETYLNYTVAAGTYTANLEMMIPVPAGSNWGTFGVTNAISLRSSYYLFG